MRGFVGGLLVALVASGLGAAPASADRDHPTTWDRGIIEHDVPVEMTLPWRVFYPQHDGYRDVLVARFFESPSTDEVMRSISVVVTGPSGAVVPQYSVPPSNLAAAGSYDALIWEGIGSNGHLAPEGTYTVQATIVDSSNDRKVVTEEIQLSHATLQDHVWRRTFRADSTIVDRSVARCAALKRPARPGWSGSLGYRSHCRSGDRSVVSTVHAVYLPRPVSRWHNWVRLSVTGADSAGGPRSSLSYVYFKTAGHWSRHVYQFGPSPGTHRGVSYRGTAAVQGRGTDDRPSFIWSVGLCCGRGYDVKSFTVTTSYRVLK